MLRSSCVYGDGGSRYWKYDTTCAEGKDHKRSRGPRFHRTSEEELAIRICTVVPGSLVDLMSD
jgi:hypothetical protein